MKKILIFLYQFYKWFFLFPFFLVNSVLFGILAVVLSLLINEKVGSVLGGVMWANLNCILTPVFIKVTGKENIQKGQSYVIVVNHQSIDDSQYVLNALERQYPKLSTVKVERSQHLKYGKKLPLTLGIKRAKYEHMLFTDADCKPASNQWIKGMVANFSKKKQIVLGYGPYEKRKGLLNFLIRFDTAWIAMNYMSMAKSGLPYMGIGRNMAYTKKVFDNVNGFKSHYAISSGDDDLFIQEAAKKRNYTINNNPDSYSYSPAPKTWKEWFNQKSRHYTTSERYKVIKKLMLGIYPLTLILLNISFVILLLDPNFFWITLASYLLLLIIKWIILGRAMSQLNEKRFIVFMPIMDIVYAILAPTMYYAIDKKELEKW